MIRTLLLILLFFLPATLQAQEATDTPRRGEGISAFLERNGRPGRAYYDEFIQLNKKHLKGKKELKYGVKYVLPPKRGKASAKKRQGKGAAPPAPISFCEYFSSFFPPCQSVT